MKCMKCGQNTFKSTTTEAIELGIGVLVIRNIPCYKCDECDEIIYTGDVVKRLEEITEAVKNLVQDITVVDYEKAAQPPELKNTLRKYQGQGKICPKKLSFYKKCYII